MCDARSQKCIGSTVELGRRAEPRYTGAIETHPSPRHILWTDEDPVAVAAMGEQLAARRPDADYRSRAGFGHYPMLEDPTRFGDAVADALGLPRVQSA